MNRLEHAWNMYGEEASYIYNGLGHRTGRETDHGREDYLLDLTRPYHNMLMMTDEGKSRTFYWDGNISAMSENRECGITPIFHYYLQDELGSPLRVSGFNADTEGKENGYLTYGYDEFGNDLYEDLYNDMEDAGIPNPYSRQGEEQPFGYTGYRRDDISGTYFAQAREYQPQNGRFTAEDVIKGNGVIPYTLNQYGYCLSNPTAMVDRDGRVPDEMDIDPEPEPEYVAVIYLLHRGTFLLDEEDIVDLGGAFGQGHAAILLVRDDGSGYFFSYAGAYGNIISGTEGWMATHLDEYGNIKSIDVDKFLESGEVYTDSVYSKKKNEEKPDEYSHGIYIPITNEEGIAMYNEAMEIREKPEQYKLLDHNCNQMAQRILAAGDKDFATMDFDWLDTRPNAVYDNETEEILENLPEGWNFGSLENLSKGISYNNGYQNTLLKQIYNWLIQDFILDGDIIYKA